ncbi:TatD family hydrolase [Candidatus Saccharibacteria bacterium]|nr:TatD family hydrolase [Candidatus Saccharibacteria bacterium]
MGYLIDSHCHLHDREFFTAEQAEEMLKRANEAGVKKIICIGTSHEDSLAARDFAAQHDNVFWTYGVHPEGAAKKDKNERLVFQKVKSQLPVAIGEVGLDYHYDGYNREAQIKLFEKMLQLAQDNDLPVSFHIREAYQDFFPVVANFPKIRGVVHSFTDSKKVLKRVLNETEFYIGVNGLATYSTLPTPPLERILLETDAPFLTPVPFRGIINEPAYIHEIAEWLAAKLGTEFKIIERETTNNARKLFGI